MFGERDQIEELIDQIHDSYEQSKFEEARKLGREACDKARQLYEETNLNEDEAQLAVCLVLLGRTHVALGEFAEAESLLQEALEIRRHREHGNAEELSEVLGELGLLYADMGEYQRAEALLREAVTIDREDYGADRSRLAWSLVYYGSVQIQFDNWPEAEQLFREAVDMLDSLPDTQTELVNHLLENFERFLAHWFGENAFATALPMAQYGAELARNYPQAEAHLRVESLLSLGDAYQGLEQPAPAEAAAHETVQLASELLEANDPLLADAYALLGQLHLEKGDLASAEKEIQGALAIYQAAGKGHRAGIIDCILELAEIALDREDFERASALYRRALAQADRADEEYRRVLVDSLGMLLDETGDRTENGEYEEALVPARFAYQLADEHRDFDDKIVAEALGRYPEILQLLGRDGEKD